MNDVMTASQKMDALEDKLMADLENAIAVRSRLFLIAEGDFAMPNGAKLQQQHPGAKMLMGDDPRLPKMPDKPTLMDFFRLRLAPPMHLLQSARHAKVAGMPEHVVLACLLHDIAVLADTAYDSDALRLFLIARGTEPVIPNNPTKAHLSLRSPSLQAAQSDRTDVLPSQRLAPHRHPLRQARDKLHRRRPARCHSDLVALIESRR